MQQEAESNDPSIIWPSRSVLQQLPNNWLPTEGVVQDVVHDGDDKSKSSINVSDNGIGASNITRRSTSSSSSNGNDKKQKKKKKLSNNEHRQNSKSMVLNHNQSSSSSASSQSSQTYYLNHVRGSTRLRQASQRLGMAMGTLFVTYLLCNPSFRASSSSFTKLDNVGLQFPSMQQVLSDLFIGILIGSTIVLVIFSVEVYMGWIKIVEYWEKVVPEERFGLNLLWDALFHVGVSVNEELM